MSAPVTLEHLIPVEMWREATETMREKGLDGISYIKPESNRASKVFYRRMSDGVFIPAGAP